MQITIKKHKNIQEPEKNKDGKKEKRLQLLICILHHLLLTIHYLNTYVIISKKSTIKL